jgi:hypothetical protein
MKHAFLSIALVLYVASALGADETYTTEFANSESPISDSGRWRSGNRDGIDWTDVKTSGGVAFGSQIEGAGGYYDDSIACLTGFPPDQSAQSTIFLSGEFPDSRETELLLRWTISPNSATGYEINWPWNGTAMQIVRWNGPVGDFTPIGYVSAGKRPATGDIWKATMVGDEITVYLNGERLGSIRDSTFTNGSPGIGFFTSRDADSNYGFSSFTAIAIGSGATVSVPKPPVIEVSRL